MDACSGSLIHFSLESPGSLGGHPDRPEDNGYSKSLVKEEYHRELLDGSGV